MMDLSLSLGIKNSSKEIITTSKTIIVPAGKTKAVITAVAGGAGGSSCYGCGGGGNGGWYNYDGDKSPGVLF